MRGVDILGVGTAEPPVLLHQADARALAARVFGAEATGNRPDLERYLSVFDTAGIETRRFVTDLATLIDGAGWKARAGAFQEAALPLCRDAARNALAAAAIEPQAITGIAVVCTTGLAVPSLDAVLISELGLEPETRRLPLFGFGCAGGVVGLARAAEMAAASPNGTVLLIVVELCSLTFRPRDDSATNLVACALFGDGAAAVVLRADDDPRLEGTGVPGGGTGALARITAWGERTWPNSTALMGWSVEDDGLGVVFSPEIPRFLRARVPELLPRLNAYGPFDAHILHPGGPRVIDAFDAVLGLDEPSRQVMANVLRTRGNMSAVTVLHVLQESLSRPDWRNGLMGAVGPGFTMGWATLSRDCQVMRATP